MDKLYSQLLSKLLCHSDQIDITVSGISMYPTLAAGDIVTIKKCSQYFPGDILVYPYKEEVLLIHRLLYINDRYFCKGDNSFRIEDISFEQILGKAVLVNKSLIEEWPEWKITLSHAVGKTFRKCHYEIATTKQTPLYKLYSELVLKNANHHLTCVQTTKFDLIQKNTTYSVVLDPFRKTKYHLDERSLFILKQLQTPCALDTLIKNLCIEPEMTLYSSQDDIMNALVKLIIKNVIEIF